MNMMVMMMMKKKKLPNQTDYFVMFQPGLALRNSILYFLWPLMGVPEWILHAFFVYEDVYYSAHINIFFSISFIAHNTIVQQFLHHTQWLCSAILSLNTKTLFSNSFIVCHDRMFHHIQWPCSTILSSSAMIFLKACFIIYNDLVQPIFHRK